MDLEHLNRRRGILLKENGKTELECLGPRD